MWGIRRCPVCNAGSHALDRLKRKFWMRLLPGSKHLRCQECQTVFVSIGQSSKVLKQGKLKESLHKIDVNDPA